MLLIINNLFKKNSVDKLISDFVVVIALLFIIFTMLIFFKNDSFYTQFVEKLSFIRVFLINLFIFPQKNSKIIL